MKKTINLITSIRKYVFLNLVVMVLFSGAVCAQTSQSGQMADVEGNNSSPGMYAQNDVPDIVNEKNESILPGVGPELNKIAKRVFSFFVNGEPSSLYLVSDEDNSHKSFALTSSFINNRLAGGLRLEFHANPEEGQGALVFRKTF